MSKSAFFLLVCVVALFSIGILMVFDTTSAEVIDRNLNISTHHVLFKQLLFGCISLMGALLIWFFGYEKVLKWIPLLFYILTLLLLLVFLPGVGQEINGAHRWLKCGPFSFQPSEFLKVVMPLYFIKLFLQEDKMHWKRFYKIIALFSIPIFLIFIEPDNGAVAMIMVMMMFLFFLCRIRWIYWLLPLFVMASVGGIYAFEMPHVQRRIQAYLHPDLDLLGKGHQPYQAKIAAGSGQLFGRGVGESLQKLNYLPAARSDYIAAIYAEEFGFIGILFLVLLYLLMTYSGLYIASRAKEKHGFYIAAILTFLVAFQAFLNLGVVSGLLPSKGINLPFFSQGGSSLLANTLVITLIMSVSRCVRSQGEEKNMWKIREDM